MTMLPDVMIALIPGSWKIGAMVRIHQRSRFTLGYGYYFNFKEPLGPWRLITGLWSYGAQTTAGGPPKVGARGRLLAEARHTRTGGMARVLSRTPGDRHLHPPTVFHAQSAIPLCTEYVGSAPYGGLVFTPKRTEYIHRAEA